jgi:Nuclease-related domain
MRCVVTSSSPKRLRIRYPGECVVCRCALAEGEEGLWDSASRTLTCLGCSSVPVAEGNAGASARREYERRRAGREQAARERLGCVGALLARVIDEPKATRVWQQGAHGEARTAERLAKHLEGSGVRLLHDRRVPRHGQANIDHIAIGPAGVLVIDTKTHRGKIKTDRVGGLFGPRRIVLEINGRDQTRLVDGVERQVTYVRDALGESAIEVRGALCFPNVEGLRCSLS